MAASIGFIRSESCSQHGRARVLIIDGHPAIRAEHALRAGASGYLMKSAPTQCVVDAIRCIMQGDVYLSPRMTSYLLGKVSHVRAERL